MGRVFQIISWAGYIFLAVIVVIAILAFTGHFDPSVKNPTS